MVGVEERQWAVMRDGQDYGSFPESILRKWISAGKIASDVRLSHSGGEWISVAQFLGTQVVGPPPELATEIKFVDEDQPGIVRLAAEDPLLGQTEAPEDTTVATVLPFTQSPGEELVRDRIVVLGRRQSGKTIFLATLYAMLWPRLRGLSAKSASGTGHRELMTVANMLKEGRWPPATQGAAKIELDLEWNGNKRTMVTLDFAGELFTTAFMHDRTEAPQVRSLMEHIDRAAAVMLLADPHVIAGLDRDAAMEDDFGLVQAVQRIRHSPGGQEVPVVFLLTKSDMHQPIVAAAGGPVNFVRQYFPALARVLQKVQIYQVSAVQCSLNDDGSLRPRTDSIPVNVEKALLYSLGLAEADTKPPKIEVHARRQAAKTAELHAAYEQVEREQHETHLLIFLVCLVVLVGLIIVGWIIYRGFIA